MKKIFEIEELETNKTMRIGSINSHPDNISNWVRENRNKLNEVIKRMNERT